MVIKLQVALSFVAIISILCGFCTAYTPADNYLISCGSSVNTKVGRRVFVADSDSGSVTLTTPKSAAVKASPDTPWSGSDSDEAAPALYQTARVFTAPSSYSFGISRPGRHFVRLHFFAFACQGYDLAAASFKVSTQDVVLMDGFAPENKTTDGTTSSAVRREFLLYVTRDTLVVTFVPLVAGGGLAFVNAVEVVSVPDDLIVHPVRTSSDQLLDPAVMPLQTAYRVNVGGAAVAADGDTLTREWTTDERYLAASISRSVNISTQELVYNGRLDYLPGQATADDAPDIVYATARELAMSDTVDQLAWQFDVDERPSSYLIRFHWCNIVGMAVAPHLLSIDAYVGSHVVVTGLNLSMIGNGALAVPYYKDFILDSSDPSGKIAVYVASSSSMKMNRSTLPGPILNGVEIMKMHFSSGSVVVVEPTAGSKAQHLAIVLGSVCGAFAAVSIAAVLVIFLRKKEEKVLPTPSSSRSQSPTPWMPLLDRLSLRSRRPGASGTGSSKFAVDRDMIPIAASPVPSYRFPFAVLRDATNDFDERLVIGAGGFGKVYRATLPDGTSVAVKRASPESRQGAREFRTEIELLSGLRHRHLVSLVGYCDEGDEMILLYEYMEHGSLRSRLYGAGAATAERALGWAQRLEACAGAARGLLYLHTALAKPVIHRDVKSSNILLDGGLAARVADFGLSRAGPELEETHVSTAVKGSFGYVDPEYVRTRQLTTKSDVYSLGVVLLEALCARPVVDPRLPKPMVNLVEWALHWQGRGELDKIVDRRIAAAVRPQALRKYGETAARCLAARGADRPAMEDVVWSLQFVTRLQDDDGLEFSDVNSLSLVRELMPPLDSRRTSSHQNEAGCEEGEGATDASFTDVDVSVSMRGVFWQMVNVGGR
ncbi:receptor-like protein kinase HERK 1 [Sorghum bicolor]|uniref:receptor-like protein kinase HERK 1 n=1 Tax=Sorghum bicolor TaxID=4558 RepID=UPI0001A85139|nr:receptor-like protein kinase HERK 1 [Sorghum bicolor]|eukprot:XP_002457318.1 receptor-like protein kinase HERK 1 [Sorghum bicolor]